MGSNRREFPKVGITRRRFLRVSAATTTALLSARSTKFLGGRGIEGNSPKVSLASSGKSSYVILVSPHANETETFAAHELQKYLYRVTGARLRIAITSPASPFISIGDCPPGEDFTVPSRFPGDDSLRMSVQDKNIVLRGATARATLYAVYAFLERLGCWWFAPKTPVFEDGAEFVPWSPTLAIEPFDVIEQPLMKYRIQDADQSRGLRTGEDWRGLIDWMAKSRSNTLAMFLDKYEANRETIARELTRRDMRGEVGKHLVTTRFLASDQYIDSHPDWYGMIDGGRTAHAGRRPVMFETANPQALATFEDNVIAYLKERQEIHALQLWPPDGCVWSQSAEARALGSPSERMALLVQSVARAIRRAGLGTQVEFLAYQGYIAPPENMNFSEDTIVDFCPISRDYAVPFNDNQNAPNRKFDGYLRKWLRRFPGEVRQYTYYAKYSWRSLPVALPGQIGHDMKYWHRIGEAGGSIYSEPGNWLALEVNHLAFARSLWDGHYEPASWYDSYLKARFGDAAEAMKQFNSLATTISLGALIPLSLTGSLSAYRPLVAQARRAMQEALERASSAQVRWAVQKLSWEADYLELGLRLREAEEAHEEGSELRTLENKLEELTASHADDGTYLTYHTWLMTGDDGPSPLMDVQEFRTRNGLALANQ